MPRRYEAIRDSLIQQGKPEAEAKRIAAATYNKTRKSGEPSLARRVAREKAEKRIGRKLRDTFKES